MPLALALAALFVIAACGTAAAVVWSKHNLPPAAPPPPPPKDLAAKFKLELVTDKTNWALGLYPVNAAKSRLKCD